MKLFDLILLRADDQQRLIARGKGAALPFAADSTIAEVFRGRASASPDIPAVVYESSSLTYRQLDEWSERVAGELAGSHGVGRDRIVALCFNHSIEMIVAIMAVWKAGGAYVPIEPETPDERVQYMLSDTHGWCSAARNTGVELRDCPPGRGPYWHSTVAMAGPTGTAGRRRRGNRVHRPAISHTSSTPLGRPASPKG